MNIIQFRTEPQTRVQTSIKKRQPEISSYNRNSARNIVSTINACTIYFKGLETALAVNKLEKFNIEEYKKLSTGFIKKIRQECVQNLNTEKITEIEKQHDTASDLIINSLNNQYGKDNWIMISLGRSVSSIANVIGYKVGENRIKQLPMTRANRFLDNRKISELKGTKELANFKDYLSSIELDSKTVNESDKHYILIDYCHSGASLLGGYKLLTSDLILGNNSRIHMQNVMNLIPETSLKEELECSLYKSKFKDYSLVKECHNLNDTAQAIYKPNELSLDAKLTRFKLLDNVMRKKQV